MTLFDVIVPPPPLQAMLGVRRATVQKKFLLITSNIALWGMGGTNTLLYWWDCLKFRKICEEFMHCFVDFIAWLLLFYLINVHIE